MSKEIIGTFKLSDNERLLTLETNTPITDDNLAIKIDEQIDETCAECAQNPECDPDCCMLGEHNYPEGIKIMVCGEKGVLGKENCNLLSLLIKYHQSNLGLKS